MENKECIYCKSQVRIDATRCPQCSGWLVPHHPLAKIIATVMLVAICFCIMGTIISIGVLLMMPRLSEQAASMPKELVWFMAGQGIFSIVVCFVIYKIARKKSLEIGD